MNLRRPGLGGGLGVDDYRQEIVVYFDQIEGIGGNVGVFRHNCGDTIPDIAHLVHGQGHMGRRLDVGWIKTTWQRANARVEQVFTRIDSDDTLQRQSGASIDMLDDSVGVGTALDPNMNHARQLEIGYIPPFPLDKTRVFYPPDALAEIFAHVIPPKPSSQQQPIAQP